MGPVALRLGAKLGDLEGKLGYREVMLKLSWAMLCHVVHVRFCSAMLLALHPEMSPCGYLMVTLVPSMGLTSPILGPC